VPHTGIKNIFILTPGSGLEKNLDPDPGIRIQGEHPRSFFRELRNSFWLKTLKFFDADPGPGIFLALDPGSRMKKKSGSRLN
jgi:hypothetical protein